MKNLPKPTRMRISLAFIFIFMAFAADSQHIKDAINYGTRAYVYKLDYKQTKDLVNNKRNAYKHIEKNAPTDTIVYSLSESDFPSLAGTYLMVYAHENEMSYSFFQNSPISVTTHWFDGDLQAKVIVNETNEPVKNCEVKFDGRKMIYNNTDGLFHLKTKSLNGNLEVEYMENTYFFSSEVNGYYNKPYQSRDRSMIATSRNLYKPGDTLKIKAFFIDKKGKPINKKLKLKISNYQFKFDTILLPTSPGAYIFNMYFSDTLPIDMNYSIYFYNEKKLLDQTSVWLEDYLLDEVTNSVQIDELNLKFGEPVKIELSSIDFNGNFIKDGMVEVNVSLDELDKLENEITQLNRLIFTTTENLDPNKPTIIIIPDTVFKSNFTSYNVSVKFSNSNQETETKTESFAFEARQSDIEIEDLNDSLLLKVFDNNTEYKGKGYINAIFASMEYNSNTSSKVEVVFPVKIRINPMVETYEVYDSTDSCIDEADLDRLSSYLKLSAIRNADSLIITVSNPRNLDFDFKIFDKDKNIVEQGNAREFNRKIFDPTEKYSYMTLTSAWIGKIQSWSWNLEKLKNELKVNIDQPTKIYPGQRVEVKVKVTDADNKAVENVNITASSQNSKLKSIAPFYPRFQQNSRYEQMNGETEIITRKKTLNITKNKKYDFKTEGLYYKFIFPGNEIFIHLDTAFGIKTAQFSPFLFTDGFQVEVKTIYLDGELIYNCNTKNESPYSFVASQGYHSLLVNTYEKSYFIDSLYLKRGVKSEISIDTETKNANINVEKIDKKAREAEKSAINNNFFSIGSGNRLKSTTIYFIQNERVNIIGENFEYGTRFIGPFKDGYITVISEGEFKDSIYFEYGRISKTENNSINFYTINHNNLNSYARHSEPAISEVVADKIYQKQYDKVFNTTSLSNIRGSFTNLENKSDLLQVFLPLDKKPAMAILEEIGSQENPRVLSFQMRNYNRRITDFSQYNFSHLKLGTYKLRLLATDFTYYESPIFEITKGNTTYLKVDETKFVPATEENKEYLEAKLTKIAADEAVRSKNSICTIKIKDEDGNPLSFVKTLIYYEYNRKESFNQISNIDGEVSFVLDSIKKYAIYLYLPGYQQYQENQFTPTNGISSEIIMFRNTNIKYLNEFYSVKARNSKPIAHKTVFALGTDESDNYKISKNGFYMNSASVVVGGVTASYGKISRNSFSQFQLLEEAVVEDEEQLSDEITIKNSASSPGSIRNNFNDEAYWQPNLFTNKDGEAVFVVKFPDDITGWESWAVGINDKQQSGMGKAFTKSFLPYSAQLSAPRFLVEGDKFEIVGKSLNFNNSPIRIRTQFEFDNQIFESADTLLNSSIIDRKIFEVNKLDSAEFTYKLTTSEGFFDGEKRSIPVFGRGTTEYKGNFVMLNSDTTISIKLDKNAKKQKISILNNSIDPILEELDELKNYEYSCNEQIASKISGLRSELKIQNQLNKVSTNQFRINHLTSKLYKNQNNDGGWGWWPGMQSDYWMTAYIVDILQEAEAKTIFYGGVADARNFLIKNLKNMNNDELVFTLNILTKYGWRTNYEPYLNKLLTSPLDQYQSLMLIRIKQLAGKSYDLKPVLALAKPTLMGNTYFDGQEMAWYGSANEMTLMAYQIIKAADSTNEQLPKIRNYFLEGKSFGKWENTIDKARVISTILPDLINEYGTKPGDAKVDLSIDGANQRVENFPFTIDLPEKSNSVTVETNGKSPIYVSYYHQINNPNPSITDSNFKVSTSLQVGDSIVKTLKPGQNAKILVKVEVKRKADHVMVEVPIPAGCTYDNDGNYSNSENYREKFKNKTNIYREKLEVGTHYFEVNLSVRYSGEFTMNPAKVELMYFPYYFGRNEVKKVTITK